MEDNKIISGGREVAFRCEHLSKTLGRRKILHDISFDAYSGEVFGLLGPNGAGKTTTIKIAVGMLMLDEGSITIGGYDLRKQYEKAMSCVGGIVENPEFYKYMSGWENLLQFARIHGAVDKNKLTEAVKTVGLENRIRDKVGKYSLGMRQRLGVAQAILHRPKLLILDEPTNGLDPAGIKDLRDILKNLAREQGCCVLVSSHLMSEMEMMCDRVGIIVNGSLRSINTVEEMVSAAETGKIDYIFHTSDAAGAIAALDFIDEAARKINDEGLLEVVLDKENADAMLARINRTVITAGIDIYSVNPKENKRLEDVFIEMTNKEGGGTIV